MLPFNYFYFKEKIWQIFCLKTSSTSINIAEISSIIEVRCVQFIPKNNLLFLGIYFFLRIITLKMKKSITDRKLIIANFTIVSYFVLIWLINVYKIDIVLIGVFRELLTIPFLIAQIVFLVIGIYF